MRNMLSVLLFFFLLGQLQAQELNATVTINTQQINQTNQSVFNTLKKSLEEFINQTKWTNLKILPNEKINCNFTLVFTKYESNNFEANLLVQATRPVFNTAYHTAILNLQDNNLAFSYQQYEPLTFQINNFESNLTSVIAYYAYIIIGFDANSFSENRGSRFFEQAQNVVINAQSSGYSGWLDDGSNNRWLLINELLASNYSNYHKAWYQYHRLGLDTFTTDEKSTKIALENAIGLLDDISTIRLNSYVVNLFFNAKADEIVSIFSGGTHVDTKILKEKLMKIAPFQTTKWSQIN